MKRISLLLLTLALLIAVALPAAAAGGPNGRRYLRRQMQSVRRVRNHRMFIGDPARPILRITPAVHRVRPNPRPSPLFPTTCPNCKSPSFLSKSPSPRPLSNSIPTNPTGRP